MKRMWLGVAIVCVGWSVQAGLIATPHVAGEYDAWAGPASYPMTETAVGSDIWTVSLSGLTPGGRYMFKVTDGTWGLSYPGDNSWSFADGSGDLTITYDGNTTADGMSPSADRLGLSTDPGSWTATGDFLSELGGVDWDNASPQGAMTALGGGLYELTAAVAPGSYLFKAVVSGSWDSISSDGRSVGTANWAFSTDAINDTVIFSVDALAGTANLQVIPEPATWALVLFGGLCVHMRRRRR